MKQEGFNKITILIAAISITILFLGIIRGFLTAIFMAALFAGILYPLYHKLKIRFREKASPAAFATILLFIFIILIPTSGFLLIVIDQAINASETAQPILRDIIDNPKDLVKDLESIPIIHRLFPEEEQLVQTIDNIVKGLA